MRLHAPPGHLREYSSSGVPIVFIGDILGGAASWSGHAEKLIDRWRVIGVSPLVVAHAAQGLAPPEPWGIDAEVQALALALDARGVRQAHIGGWSLGGAIALGFALTHPQRTLTLTLVEPQVRWVLRGLGREEEADANSEAFKAYAALDDVDEKDLARFLHEVGAVPPGENPQDSRAWRLAWQNRLAIRYAPRVVEHHDEVGRLSKLDMPTLLVSGADGVPTDRAIAEAIAGLIPAAELLILPGGHTSHLTSMGQFLDAFAELAARAG